MKDRCSGSVRLPVGELATVPHRRRPGVVITLGSCSVCGAWMATRHDGTVRVHVNWPARTHRQAQERRLEGGLFDGEAERL